MNFKQIAKNKLTLPLQDIISQINAELHGKVTHVAIDSVSIYNCSMQNNENMLFIEDTYIIDGNKK